MGCVSAHTNSEALKLPDQLLVRYFRAGEIENVATVDVGKKNVGVVLKFPKRERVDRWQDLGGGLGFVPAE